MIDTSRAKLINDSIQSIAIFTKQKESFSPKIRKESAHDVNRRKLFLIKASHIQKSHGTQNGIKIA